MANNEERKCPMDCAKCTFRQNVYCSAQIGLSNHEVINRLEEKIDSAEGKINDVLSRMDKVIGMLEALQADMLIEPMAQEEEAAQTEGSPNNQK